MIPGASHFYVLTLDASMQKASSILLKYTEETLKSWAILASSLTGKIRKDESKTIALIKDSSELKKPDFFYQMNSSSEIWRN